MAIRPTIAPELWDQAKADFNSNKVALGRYIAENHPSSRGDPKSSTLPT
jgi:hypothetical protein